MTNIILSHDELNDKASTFFLCFHCVKKNLESLLESCCMPHIDRLYNKFRIETLKSNRTHLVGTPFCLPILTKFHSLLSVWQGSELLSVFCVNHILHMYTVILAARQSS